MFVKYCMGRFETYLYNILCNHGFILIKFTLPLRDWVLPQDE